MLKKGDHVKWKFRYGETQGVITKIHTSDFVFMNRQRRASEESPQYEVMSEKTGKTAVHRSSALKKNNRIINTWNLISSISGNTSVLKGR